MTPLDWGDDVTVSVLPRQQGAAVLTEDWVDIPGPNQIRCVVTHHPSLSGAANLAFQAATQVCRLLGWTDKQIDIEITKRIWVGAGLGGGSSDAGAVFRILAEFAKKPVEIFTDVAAQLGADIPFFLTSGAKVVSGIGTTIERHIDLESAFVVLVNPNQHMSTQQIYQKLNILADVGTPQSSGRLIDMDWDRLSLDDLVRMVNDDLGNDLESAAFDLCPMIQEIKAGFGETDCILSLMSGSGSTVFGLFEQESEACRARDMFSTRYPALADAHIVSTELSVGTIHVSQ